jgi:hypothetical protein
MAYTERCFEQLSFVPTGGHRWVRSLQIRIPSEALPGGSSWRIVSLGVFARRRFPDFVVTDCHHRRISLLTREQHGTALTHAALNRFIDRLPVNDDLSNTQPGPLVKLRKSLYDFFTAAGELPMAKRNEKAEDLTREYATILRTLPFSEQREEEWLESFASDILEMIDSTRYLCWVKARPAELINLDVSYTAEDEKYKAERSERFFERLGYAMAEPRHRRQRVWADWYRRLGIAPLNYEFNVPSRNHAGSYYFTIDAPTGTYVTYLDWIVGSSFANETIDCAFPSAHVQNAEVPAASGDSAVSDLSDDLSRGRTIRAYIRSKPLYHNQIIGTAALNGVLVYALTFGRLPVGFGESAQSLIVAIPSVLTAYLVQQEQHYHAHTMRIQRGVLWGYLGISVMFLIAILFSHSQGALGSRGLGVFASGITWMAAASAALFVWYLPQGGLFDRWTKRLMQSRERRTSDSLSNKKAALDRRQKETASTHRTSALDNQYEEAMNARIALAEQAAQPWRCYEHAVRKYCACIFWAAIVAAAATLAIVMHEWQSPRTRSPVQPGASPGLHAEYARMPTTQPIASTLSGHRQPKRNSSPPSRTEQHQACRAPLRARRIGHLSPSCRPRA